MFRGNWKVSFLHRPWHQALPTHFLHRNGGHINPPLYHDYEELKNTLGLRAAQHIIRFRLAHLEIQQRVGETDAPDADCRTVEAVDVYYDEETFEEAKRLLKVYKRDMPVEGQQYECVVGEAARKVSERESA